MNYFFKLLVAGVLCITASAKAQSWVTYTTTNSQIPNSNGEATVYSIAFDASGNAWLGMQDSGVVTFNGTTTWTMQWDNFLNPAGGGSQLPSSVGALYYNKGSVWAGSEFQAYGGLFQWNGSTWTNPNNYVDNNANQVYAVTSDNSGNMWFATDNNLSELTAAGSSLFYLSSQPTTNFPDNDPDALAADNNGNIWVGFGQDDGLVKMNIATGVGILYDNASNAQIPQDNVQAIAIDLKGNIWAGTSGGGVYEYNPTTNTVINAWSVETLASFISDNIYCITVDPTGNVWIGTDQGAAVWNGSAWTKFTMLNTNGMLPNDTVNAIAWERAKNGLLLTNVICFGTQNGLAEYTPKSTAVAENTGILANDNILSQNYPNPFASTTEISFSLPRMQNVSLQVYNELGNEISDVAHGTMDAGVYSFNFDASNLPEGVYYYRLISDGIVQTKTMMVVK